MDLGKAKRGEIRDSLKKKGYCITESSDYDEHSDYSYTMIARKDYNDIIEQRILVLAKKDGTVFVNVCVAPRTSITLRQTLESIEIAFNRVESDREEVIKECNLL